MRLVNSKTLQLHDFSPPSIPKYAILSHTWGEDEITFQDMVNTNGTLNKRKSYEKLEQSCRLSQERELDYIWIDTCCIDKSSSAELTESINSMFQWYKNAVVCFVWLEDVQQHDDGPDGIRRCRWFRRGWTLQELLAPQNVEFYDGAWHFRGSKSTLTDLISEITRIPVAALRDSRLIRTFSVAQRMSWAFDRATTRPEDIAYSLLGIFDVNMPLIYGEGEKAFRRLQEEIVKHNNDLTIFAWQNFPTQSLEVLKLFASSPLEFGHAYELRPDAFDQASFSVTNKGLLMVGGPMSPVMFYVKVAAFGETLGAAYYLPLGTVPGPDGRHIDGGLLLRKLGPTLFCRDSRYPLVGFDLLTVDIKIPLYDIGDYHILADNDAAAASLDIDNISRRFRLRCIHVPLSTLNVTLRNKSPRDLWDESDRVFLSPSPYGFLTADTQAVLSMAFDVHFESESFQVLVVCYHFGTSAENLNFFLLEYKSDLQQEKLLLFSGRNSQHFMSWGDLLAAIPNIIYNKTFIDVVRESGTYRIELSFERERAKRWSHHWMVPGFRVTRRDGS